MTARVVARVVLVRLARPRSLALWALAVAVALGIWALLSAWWGTDLDDDGLVLVSAGLVMGLVGSTSLLLASDVVRLALVAGSTRRRVLAAWALVAPAVVVPVVAVVTASVALVSSSWGWTTAALVPIVLVAVTLWFGGLGVLCALASDRLRVRRLATPALLLLALGSVLGAAATAFDPAPGWSILALALILTGALTILLTLRTAVPPDAAGLLAGPTATTTTRKVAR